jgi:hypothetical protein
LLLYSGCQIAVEVSSYLQLLAGTAAVEVSRWFLFRFIADILTGLWPMLATVLHRCGNAPPTSCLWGMLPDTSYLIISRDVASTLAANLEEITLNGSGLFQEAGLGRE